MPSYVTSMPGLSGRGRGRTTRPARPRRICTTGPMRRPCCPRSSSRNDPATQSGALHFSDLGYIFGTLSLHASQRQYTDVDTKLSDTISSYWVNFAKTAIPTVRVCRSGPSSTKRYANPVLYIGAQTQPGPMPNAAGLDLFEAYLQLFTATYPVMGVYRYLYQIDVNVPGGAGTREESKPCPREWWGNNDKAIRLHPNLGDGRSSNGAAQFRD